MDVTPDAAEGGLSRLDAVFATARAEGRAALVGYLPAGFPTVEDSIAAMRAMVEGGVDAIEVGLPYSDPQMDGPVIQRAADRALAGGTRTPDVLRAVRELAATGAAALVMTYWNPIDRYGVERFATDFAAAGGAALITPDLVPEEAADWLAASESHGVGRVFLVAPSSTDARIAATVRHCRGFVYAASLMGVTGARESVSSGARTLVGRVREATTVPVCVGLGVSTADHAREVAQYADGVIVGSAFVRCLLEAPDSATGIARAHQLAVELAAGVRAAATVR